MNNKKISIKNGRLAIALIALYASLPLFIMNTNPSQMPLPLLLVPFLLLFMILFVTIYLIGARVSLLRGLEKRRQYIVAALLAAIPLLLLVFQSLRQLTIRDVIIGIGLVIAVSFYISRADFLR